MCSFDLYAQINISGIVKDNNGELLPGVSILVKEGNQTNGTTTDVDGRYTIKVKPGAILEFSFIGFITQKVEAGTRNIVNIVLEPENKILDEVVVIGYGSTTKKELTGSVTSMKKDELNMGTFTSAMGMLQGKVAGLQILNPNGADPTAKYEVLLRGTNTLSAGQGPLIIIDGVAGFDIQNIKYQEVESIDVLKDGSAAAIYGTRGTNGVIIITTKRAKAGKTEVSYEGQFTVGMVSHRAKPLTANEFRSVINEYRPELKSYLFDYNTDWFDEITQTPYSHKHNLSISGGTDKFSHHTSFNYERSEGLQKYNSSEKLMARTNVRQSVLERWLTLDYNLNIVHRKYNPASRDAFMQAFTHNPTEAVYDVDNTNAGGYSSIKAMAYYNPVAMINERDVESKDDNYGANMRATLNLLPVEGLKWENFVSYNKEQYETREYYSHYYPSLIGTDGQAYIENYQSNDTQYESTLSYQNTFKKHSIQVLLGYTYQYSYSTTASMQNSGFDFDDNKTNNIGSGISLTEGKASMYSMKEDNTYIGFFGRVMYNYDNKYLLSASLRRDGSSRFGTNNKWGWFPAVSVGWRLNREKFLSEVKWINDLKLRLGYGITGNQDFANYKSLMMMTTAGKFYYNGQWINTYQPVSNANPNLKWEKKAEFNVGVDASVLDNKLSFTFDYYKRTTSNLLYDYAVPTPPYVYNTLFTNVGKVTNEGIELTLSGVPIMLKKFSWNTTFTVSHNKNKLVKFTNEEFTNGSYKVGWSTSASCYTQRLIEGKSLGTFYAPIWLGTDTDGTDVLLGQNADGSVPEDQWAKIGCAYPDATLSWSNTLKYKNFDLNFSLRASIGGKILNNYAMEYENLSNVGLRNISSNWLSQSNFTSTQYKYSSKYIEDASYLKLDNISLGYNWNINSMLLKRIRLTLTAQNVFCITGYSGVDPEVALSGLTPGIESLSYYPRTTEFTFGVNVAF
jgi:TonB-linked SusC/RagA family outer membrane protein